MMEFLHVYETSFFFGGLWSGAFDDTFTFLGDAVNFGLQVFIIEIVGLFDYCAPRVNPDDF